MHQSPAAPPAAVPPNPLRRVALERWLGSAPGRLGLGLSSLAAASSDASFRRYWRLSAAGVPGGTCIVMDAPPPLEDVRPFLHVASLLEHAGLPAPRVLHSDPGQGFVLLSDLGTRTGLQHLREADAGGVDRMMRCAVQLLVRWQQAVDACALPVFDAAVLREELELFPTWCVQRAHGRVWNARERGQWEQVCERLIGSALGQAQVAVHRDWMPRNWMVIRGEPAQAAGLELGILDFQDAARGAISYDMASMLRDAFISWEEEQELDWGVRYWEAARRAGLPVAEDFGVFWRELEWMGLQRHLRILGVFCRLKHRDGKPAYAEDLPRFLGYATKVALRYRELGGLLPLLEPLSGQAVQSAYTF